MDFQIVFVWALSIQTHRIHFARSQVYLPHPYPLQSYDVSLVPMVASYFLLKGHCQVSPDSSLFIGRFNDSKHDKFYLAEDEGSFTTWFSFVSQLT